MQIETTIGAAYYNFKTANCKFEVAVNYNLASQNADFNTTFIDPASGVETEYSFTRTVKGGSEQVEDLARSIDRQLTTGRKAQHER